MTFFTSLTNSENFTSHLSNDSSISLQKNYLGIGSESSQFNEVTVFWNSFLLELHFGDYELCKVSKAKTRRSPPWWMNSIITKYGHKIVLEYSGASYQRNVWLLHVSTPLWVSGLGLNQTLILTKSSCCDRSLTVSFSKYLFVDRLNW